MSDPVSSFELSLEQLDGYAFKIGWDKPWAELKTDEPAPLGKDAGPGPSRMFAVAVANCLASSLIFCLSRKGEQVSGVTARVKLEIVRNEERRLRVGKIDVTLRCPLERDSKALLECMDTFEDFCTITESVRAGVQVNVNVEAIG